MMEGRAKYLAVGIFIIALVCAAIAIFFWLTLRKHDQTYSTYVVYLHEEVSGLSVQSSVRYNGVPVGYVKSIGLVPSNPQLVKIMLDIEQNTPINTSTVATLMSQGITGIDYIGLQSQKVNAPPLTKHAGEDYPVIHSKPSLLMQLSEVIPEITQKVTQLSDSISTLFDKKNTDSIGATLQNVQVFTRALKDSSAQITESMASLQKILVHAQAASKGLPDLVESTTDTMKQLHSTAESATNTMKAGRAAINALSQQLVPSAQQALQQLGNIEVNLQQFTSQLKRNPAMIIRGKQADMLGPGER
jgi:phospholipid/cholesterol/gamma-HCH transport system substrate-binding protein